MDRWHLAASYATQGALVPTTWPPRDKARRANRTDPAWQVQPHVLRDRPKKGHETTRRQKASRAASHTPCNCPRLVLHSTRIDCNVLKHFGVRERRSNKKTVRASSPAPRHNNFWTPNKIRSRPAVEPPAADAPGRRILDFGGVDWRPGTLPNRKRHHTHINFDRFQSMLAVCWPGYSGSDGVGLEKVRQDEHPCPTGDPHFSTRKGLRRPSWPIYFWILAHLGPPRSLRTGQEAADWPPPRALVPRPIQGPRTAQAGRGHNVLLECSVLSGVLLHFLVCF